MSLLSLSSTVKPFLQIAHDKEDIPLQIMLDALEEWVAEFGALRFNATTADAIVEENVDGGKEHLWPRQHPILTVTSIQDRDASNADIGSTLWRYNRTRIWYRDGGWWSAGTERYLATYTAGYTADTLPAGLKLILMQLMHRAYNARGGVTSDSVAGYNEKWADLLSTDELTQLRTFGFRRTFS